MRHLPSLQAIRALDALHRLGSMWRAAEELNLSSSAVSHQLRALELDLGFPLTVKTGRGVQLTPRALRFAREARKALTILAEASASPETVSFSGYLKVSCTAGFGISWLCPRIGEFAGLYPDIRVEITTPRLLQDVSAPDTDVFIAFGEGDWSGFHSILLKDIYYSPVCSPALLNAHGGMNTPADLARYPLLHLIRTEDWGRWLATAGVHDIDVTAGILFPETPLIQAATFAGQGVALGDTVTTSPALTAGTLVRPFTLMIKAPWSYYVVIRPERVEKPVVKAFVAWLTAGLETSFESPLNAPR